MNNVTIRIEGLSKSYRIGRAQDSYSTLRDSLADAFRHPIRHLLHRHQSSDVENTLWALQDVSLTVAKGEVVGVIGRNGAGKSTLLKILSRITDPSDGFAELRGRASCLLEVGTGFHAELTGRENIYLNGAILGMKRSDIARKFDEIVAFAEVAKMIDTPVKHYSTGMYLRLAFAVAAHLEPEILLVDEVLAVGDAMFQKKCLGRMDSVARDGRTVLFVSHNMAAVRALCTRAVVLDRGRLTFAGPTEHAIHHYHTLLRSPELTPRSGEVSFTDLHIDGRESGSIRHGEAFEVSCRLHLRSDLVGFVLFCVVEDGAGEPLAMVAADHRDVGAREPGSYEVTVRFPGLWLRTGVYNVYFKLIASGLGLSKSKFVSDVAMLDITGDPHPGIFRAVLTPAADWRVKRASGIARISTYPIQPADQLTSVNVAFGSAHD